MGFVRREDIQAFIRILAEHDKRITKLEDDLRSLLNQQWAPPQQYTPQLTLFDQEAADEGGEAQP